ncbi:hypothetical protein B296_00035205 [Ensete ventricosum]|uniref:Phosphatidylinositol-specific phospholipase C X domain-containing protein n=1 Tax=Ensete ventricosum TaxID=4639 RepID=A0A426YRX3_ENSVE|nr:hypothetical protein B296_00035205 [Ensete ventricosum]
MQVCCYISAVAQIYLGSEPEPSTAAAVTAFAATAPFTPSSFVFCCSGSLLLSSLPSPFSVSPLHLWVFFFSATRSLVRSACPTGTATPGCIARHVWPTATSGPGGNGLPFNRYAWLTTHNSFARLGQRSRTGTPVIAPENQQDSVTGQLNVSATVLLCFDGSGLSSTRSPVSRVARNRSPVTESKRVERVRWFHRSDVPKCTAPLDRMRSTCITCMNTSLLLAIVANASSALLPPQNGVRGLMLDMYDFENDIWLCHSFAGNCFNFTAFVSCRCSRIKPFFVHSLYSLEMIHGQQPALDVLKEIQLFLEANPSEVITIFVEDYVTSPKGLTKVFNASGLMKYWFPVERMPKNGGDWPLLSDMISRNERLLVFTSKAAKEASEGIAYEWRYLTNRCVPPNLIPQVNASFGVCDDPAKPGAAATSSSDRLSSPVLASQLQYLSLLAVVLVSVDL